MNIALDQKDLLVKSLPTPNPFALKFVVNQPLKSEGKATFFVPQEADGLPLVRDMFGIAGVRQVHVFQNTLTVTHAGDLDDAVLAEAVESVIRTRIGVHNPEFAPEPETAKPKSRHHEDPLLTQIEQILDRTIRPGLQADGGDIEVLELKDNELQILYQGACGGCPSSLMGTLDAIQGILRHELANDDITVVPVG